MLTSIKLLYTTMEKNEQMQPVKKQKERTIRVEEISVANKTATELGTLGFRNIRRFKARFISNVKTSQIDYVRKDGVDYSVNSIRDDGSGKFVIIEVAIND